VASLYRLILCALFLKSLWGIEASATEKQNKNAFDAIKKVFEASDSLRAINNFDSSCSCVVGEKENEIPFETLKQCGEDRSYIFQALKSFKKIDPSGSFWKSRKYVAAENTVPPKCILYIMRTALRDFPRTAEQKQDEELKQFLADGKDTSELKDKIYKPDPQQYAQCKDETGEPIRIGGKPCVTEEYVNLVYNSLSDVSDCLGVPMNFTVPKFANESGFHFNAFGPVNDGGIGQFTESALKDVAQNFEEFQPKITSSPKQSCKRLKSIKGALPRSSEEILTSDANRCHAIGMPPNPIRSLIYYGIFYRATLRNSEKAWSKQDETVESVDQVLLETGVKELDLSKIKQMLFTLSYNAGPRPPVIAFKEWLKYRKSKKAAVTKSDLNFDFWPKKGFGTIEKEITDSLTKRAEELGWSSEELKQEIVKERYKRKITHLGAEKRALTFPEYLYVYRNNIYISAVKAQANVLTKSFGDGVCSPKNFLAL
jgi:hypothetical protein